MLVELITVLEVGALPASVQRPTEYDYWNYTEKWDKYHQACYVKAGFKDILKPYLAGSIFFKLSNISNDNLVKIIEKHTYELRTGVYDVEQASALFGGYVLKIDGKDKYFPQCCGDLADIRYWESLANGEKSYCEGHPGPAIDFKNEFVIFDFIVGKYDEWFTPPPPENILKVDRKMLKKAVEDVKIELELFAQRLKKINIDENFGIVDVDKLLIWGWNN
jgi:hypothetical protein